jgi:signal transduction histidine kinase
MATHERSSFFLLSVLVILLVVFVSCVFLLSQFATIIAGHVGWMRVVLDILILSVVLIFPAAFLLSYVATRPVRILKSEREFFTSNVAHELRTPLANIRIATETIQTHMTDASSASLQEFTGLLIDEVDRMSEVIKYFLYFSSGNEKLPRIMHVVNLPHLVDRAINGLRPLTLERHVTIDTEKVTTGFVWGNAALLEEMMSHIIKNAVAHSPVESTVRIALTNFEHHVRLTIADEGTGVDAKELPNIFNAFFRGKNAVGKGRGLGLSIVKEIAGMHFARIKVFNNSFHGATFIVDFSK